MPKVTYLGTPTKPRRDPIKDVIQGQQRDQHITDAQLGAFIGLCRSSMNVRLNNVHTDDWTLGEIKTVWRKLGLPIDELRSYITNSI